jgi:hypothetical protein
MLLKVRTTDRARNRGFGRSGALQATALGPNRHSFSPAVVLEGNHIVVEHQADHQDPPGVEVE